MLASKEVKQARFLQRYSYIVNMIPPTYSLFDWSYEQVLLGRINNKNYWLR
jgi:hypothetical protein